MLCTALAWKEMPEKHIEGCNKNHRKNTGLKGNTIVCLVISAPG